MVGFRVAAIWMALILMVPLVAAAPNPGSHYGSLVNYPHDHRDLLVVVEPPMFASTSASVGDGAWVSEQPVRDYIGTQALLEAIDYWEWMLAQSAGAFPHAAQLTFDVKVVGVDALPTDVARADIHVVSTMVNDPIPGASHLGIGLPTLPPDSLLFGTAMDVCTVINTGAGSDGADHDPLRLRNLMVHEFGHCIAAGHTYGAWNGYTWNPGWREARYDVMAGAHGKFRQCISNLNVLSVDAAYDALDDGRPLPSYVYMNKGSYRQSCMPASLERF